MRLFEGVDIEVETLASGYVVTAKNSVGVITNYAHYNSQAAIDGLFNRLSNIAIANVTEGDVCRSSVTE